MSKDRCPICMVELENSVFNRLKQLVLEHKEKYGSNYITVPTPRGELHLLTEYGEKLLSGEGMLGAMKIAELEEEIICLKAKLGIK